MSRTVVHMVGNAHLDPVWLWGWQEGADEVIATFGSAADRCDEYPEFVFTAGEAWRYDVVRRLDKRLFERIREHVAAGRWSVVGSQWVQPDCNLPTRTALVRQLEHGQRWFHDVLGAVSKVGFNPDSFGHPGHLPDILVGAGLSAYAFHRPGLSQLELPGNVFRWRGVGGGEVLATRIVPSYVTRSAGLQAQIELCLEAADPTIGHAMCCYGVGNHGGGPTKAQIEYIAEHAQTFPDVELRFSTPDAFFEAIAAARETLPLFEGELQHVFPGCYSVMHDVKQRQRRAEHRLAQAERVVALLAPESSTALADRLDAAWKPLLFTSFHDILAGTSVGSTWESVRAMQSVALHEADTVVYDATRGWAAEAVPRNGFPQIVVVNADDEAWEGIVEVTPWIDFVDWGARWLGTADGNALPSQEVDAESDALMSKVLVPLRIEPASHRVVVVRDDAPPPGAPPALEGAARAEPGRLGNGRVEVELSTRGIGGISLDGRPVVGEQGVSLQLRHDTTDTWTMTTDRFVEAVADRLEGLEWHVVEEGPLRASAVATGRVGTCPVQLEARVERDAPSVELRLTVVMVEPHVALQLTATADQTPTSWLTGIGGAHVERSSSTAEFPAQGWSAWQTADGGLGLVTGDAYSVSLNERTLCWTLLRTPRMAWPPVPSARRAPHRHTDLGEHEFVFQLVPGAPHPHELERRARQQLQPVLVFASYAGVDRPPWGAVPPRKLWTEAEHRAGLEPTGG